MGAAGEVDLHGDDGNIMIGDGGKVKICGDCCPDWANCSPTSLSVTLAGFNGNSCVDCIDVSPGGSGTYTNGRNVDGTYSVPFDFADANSCRFKLDIADAGPFVTFNQFSDDSCATPTSQADIGGDLVFRMSVSKTTGLITLLIIAGGPVDFVNDIFGIFNGSVSGPHDFGDIIDNTYSCAITPELLPWENGTAEVNLE